MSDAEVERKCRMFSEILTVICGSTPNPQHVKAWVKWEEDCLLLHDWACAHRPVAWMTGVGILEGVEAIVDNSDESPGRPEPEHILPLS